MTISAPNPSVARAPHRPLAQGAALRLLPEACIALRCGAAACRACQGVCPVQALAVNGDGPRLVADCLPCGRCAAACPSGALQVDGFIGVPLPAGSGPVEVECSRAPVALAPRAIRVPCLGGVTPAGLLRWWLAAGGAGLTLVNRGGCQDCSLGGQAFAAQGAMDQASAWLGACGVEPARQPRSRRATGALRPLPEVARDAARDRRPLSRRGFLRRVTTEVGQAVPVAAAPAGPRALLHREPCPLPAREELLDALGEVAASQGSVLPRGVLPGLAVDATRCTDHGLCASACPTGALRRFEDDGRSELRFETTRCVSCRRCEQACPEHALQWGDAGPAAASTLRSTALRSCIECGAEFAPRGARALCIRCATGASLARSMFGTRIAEA